MANHHGYPSQFGAFNTESGLCPRINEDSGLQFGSKESQSGIEVSGSTTNPRNIDYRAGNSRHLNPNTRENYGHDGQVFGQPVDESDYRPFLPSPQSPEAPFQDLYTISINTEEGTTSRQASSAVAPSHTDANNEPNPLSSTLTKGEDNKTQNTDTTVALTQSKSTAGLSGVDFEKLKGKETIPSNRHKKGYLKCFGGALPQRKAWRITFAGVFVCLVAGITALAIVFANSRHGSSIFVSVLTITNAQPSTVLSIPESGLGARDVIYGTYFSNSVAEKPQTKVVWDAGDGRLCVKTKLAATWLVNVDCVTDANPKKNTPLTLVDWLGGPSIAFLDVHNHLSSINYVPSNDTWILSNLIEQKVLAHESSKLNSVTWLNGTSIWLYYQDVNGNLAEYGQDDYRDRSWREGVVGPLARAVEGSSFGVSRYMQGPDEVEELFFQASNGAIHGKRFANNVWDTEIFNVAGTETGVPARASMTSTTIIQGNTSMLLLAYIASNGYVTTQTRGTTNVSNFGDFSAPSKVIATDGPRAGLAVDGLSGTPKMYLLTSQRLLELTGNVIATNWTTADITS